MVRALFVGARTPLAAGILAGWLASGNEVAEFWCREAGAERARPLTPERPVARLINRHGLPVRTVPRLSRWPELMEAVRSLDADVLIAGATMLIIPEPMLAHFGSRAVNVHPAILPSYRGPTPYLPMLLDGRADTDGGVTLHVLAKGIDEGDIIAAERVPYSRYGDFTGWYAGLVGAAYRIVRDKLPRYLAGGIEPQPQHGGTYTRMMAPHILDPALGAVQVGTMLERGGSTEMLAVAIPGRSRSVRVTAVRKSGPRTGRPPELRPLSVQLDFADARLTLRRATGIERRLRQIRLARELGWLQP